MKDTKTIVVWASIVVIMLSVLGTAVIVAVHLGETWAIVLCTAIAVVSLILVGVAISNIAVWSNWAQDKQLMNAQARTMNDDVMSSAKVMAELQKVMLANQRTFTEQGRLEKLSAGGQAEPQYLNMGSDIYHGLED